MSATAPTPRRYRTAAEVNSTGIKALVAALGVSDTARFLQQYGPGLGDYTAERDATLGDMDLDEAVALAQKHSVRQDP